MKERIKDFMKRETILTAALVLALVSCFFVPPDKNYSEYIDVRTLILLFCLMAVMAGLKDLGVFRYIGEKLLGKVHSLPGIIGILVALCFLSGMIITNDVALITFVPFGILVLKLAEMENFVCITITLMTIAANLGSMLTPIGNPQNLYLYSASGISVGSFLWLMLPYSLFSALMLALVIFFFCRKKTASNEKMNASSASIQNNVPNLMGTIYYLALFFLCLAAVMKAISIYVLLPIIIIAVFIKNKKLLLEVDYNLLLTFVAFFLFIGNMGRIPWLNTLLVRVVNGHETIAAILLSQIISNVPAALLLSGFTTNLEALIVGTNIGGLGTLIASMASLISYKQIVQQYPEQKGRYFKIFTLWNVVFLFLFLIFCH